MNHHDPGCRLTAADHAACGKLIQRLEKARSPLLPLLREKLDRAAIIADDRIDPLVATLNSRVEYRMGDRPLQTRILVGCEFRNGLVGLTLPVTTPYGLALLGLRQGQSVAIERDGEGLILLLNRVVYQPQAARHRRPLGIVHTHQDGSSAEIIDLARVRKQAATLTRRVSL